MVLRAVASEKSISSEMAAHLQIFHHLNRCVLGRNRSGIDGQFGRERRFIRIVDSREVFQPAGASFFVEALGIALSRRSRWVC